MSNNLLSGKRGIITGALDENSIAWKVAERAHAQGAKFVLTNAPVAMRMGELKKLSDKTKSEIIPADATLAEDITNLFQSDEGKWINITVERGLEKITFKFQLEKIL